MTKGIADIPEWFHGCRLNFAENLLQCQEDRVALITYGEGHSFQALWQGFFGIFTDYTQHSKKNVCFFFLQIVKKNRVS